MTIVKCSPPILSGITGSKPISEKSFGILYFPSNNAFTVPIVTAGHSHIKAVEYLQAGNESNIFNLGNGVGFSVKEMINSAKDATKEDIKVVIGERRAGDPARLIASNEKARKILGWIPKYTDVKDVINTAWGWHKSHPDGYGDRK